jgi:molybdenum cofactor cytidylyltransferase
MCIRESLICIIVLAAGLSKRFGRNKLLVRINGFSMIEIVVRSATESKADEVVVVSGYEADLIKKKLKGFDCKFAHNENFQLGQSSSVKVGLLSVMQHAKALMVLPGDVALITPKAINMVIEEYERYQCPIVVATHQGQFGHPILFDRTLFNEITNINEETRGLKAVVNRHRSSIREVEIGSDEVLMDLDTEEDLKKHVGKYREQV